MVRAVSPPRGWCPTAHLPMPSGDGLLARIRPPAARLSAAQARVLDQATTRWGNGIIELTGRGNLQCRGLSATTFPLFLEAVCAAGLADPDPLADGRRRLIVAPLLGGTALLDRLEAALGVASALDHLAPKFVIRVDGGPLAIGAIPADLAIDPGGLTLGAWRAPAANPVDAAIACAAAIATRGAKRAREIDHPASLLAAIRLNAVPAAQPLPPPQTIGAFTWGVGVAPGFGQLDAGELTALAALADAHADGTLRITPFRSILLPGAGASALAHAAGRFVTWPDDPRLRIRACIGAPGCLSGQAPARAVAGDYLTAVPHAGILHLSGCAKGCAHPKPAARTFVGRNGVLEEAMQEGGGGVTRDHIREGDAIYARSFAIIRAETELARFDPVEERCAVRIVHSCGMTDVAADLRFTHGFASAARAALRAGAPILCDSRMVAEGITRARLPAANRIICTLAAPGIPALAASLGRTRSAAALELWREHLAGGLVAIGNAPTALFRLLEMLDEGASRPAAVIGMPVGFVGAAESKEALLAEAGLPAAVVLGRRGGSAMTVACVNALASDDE